MSQIDRQPAKSLPVPLQVPPLLARLRAETHAAHERIEAAPALCCLMSPALTVPSYVHALRALHAFHARMWITLPGLLEDFLKSFAASGGAFAPDAAARDALAEDIAWFGERPLATMNRVASVNDAASALGALYVVEGSALGARVIGRAVSASLDVSPGHGGSFFCRATADAARTRWQSFSDLLGWAGAHLSQHDGDRMVVAGIDVFACLEREFATPAGGPPAINAAAPPPLSLLPAHAAGLLN